MSPSTFSQMFPPTPDFTEKDLADLLGKVYIVTGATSGIGLELAKILYSKNATVYLGARNATKAEKAINDIQSADRNSKGKLGFLELDTSDLPSVRKAATAFLTKETRLDVLFNNAGVMMPPPGTLTKQGHDLQIATNCLGPYLLTRLLTPLLAETAKVAPPASVRIVYVASMLASGAMKGGMILEDSGAPKVVPNEMESYMATKVGNTFLAVESAKEQGSDDVIRISLHPGIMATDLQRHKSPIPLFMIKLMFKDAKYGAYTELAAGLSPKVTAEKQGAYMVPWGRFADIPEDIEKGLKSNKEGGTGIAKKFYGWVQQETAAYV